MKIEQTKVTKLRLSQLNGLDPIEVYLEDYRPGEGKITITCYGQSWTSFWSAMSGMSISEFFLSCDNHYLAKNLSSIEETIPDTEAAKKDLLSQLDEKLDGELIDEVEAIEDIWAWIKEQSPLAVEVYGREEWWHADVPQRINPRYAYLCRIIDAVKGALFSLKDDDVLKASTESSNDKNQSA